jgi:hypothetical protein
MLKLVPKMSEAEIRQAIARGDYMCDHVLPLHNSARAALTHLNGQALLVLCRACLAKYEDYILA